VLGLDPARESVRGLAANLHVRVLGGEADQFLSHLRRQRAAPFRLTCHTPERMCSVTAHSRYGVVEEASDRFDGTRIGNMIEHLYTPPTDPGVLIGQSFYHGVEGARREFGFLEVGGSNAASESAKGLNLTAPLAELLNQDLFWCHSENGSRGIAPSRKIIHVKLTTTSRSGHARSRYTPA
jgi:hypothetical protein